MSISDVQYMMLYIRNFIGYMKFHIVHDMIRATANTTSWYPDIWMF